MAHYFIHDPSLEDHPFLIHFSILDREFALCSNAGVFAKDKLDQGTRLLLETVLKAEKDPQTTLDLGCGIGVVGVVLSTFWKTKMTMIEINERAAKLAQENMDRYHYPATLLNQDGIQEGVYDCILFNPPIRVGKEKMYALFKECIAHLSQEGRLWIVMRKAHGAESAVKYFQSLNTRVERVTRKQGYWILKITKA